MAELLNWIVLDFTDVLDKVLCNFSSKKKMAFLVKAMP